MQKIELQIMWKEITKQQKRRKEMTRDEFMSKLIFEEKTWEIASNMDMVNRFHLCKMVTKNLLYLIHARRHFGLVLDLNQNTSIVDSVMTYI